jgi:class 3 adenylate cyclase
MSTGVADEPLYAEPRVFPARRVERKLVTVMFVDVKGSTALSRAIDVEAWWSVVSDLFELMCESVYQLGGWVANFTGDGIQAIFEADDDTGDDALRACRAAVWVRDAVRAPAAELRRDHGLELSLRIGINSGEVVTGTIGDRFKRYYTANGYAVALAKRMETLALPDRIYLTEHTADLVSAAVQVRDLGRHEVKGAEAAVGVFELLGGLPAATSGAWSSSRLHTA